MTYFVASALFWLAFIFEGSQPAKHDDSWADYVTLLVSLLLAVGMFVIGLLS